MITSHPKEQFYTVPCRAFNPNARFQKMIRLYDKRNKRYLPNFWVYEKEITMKDDFQVYPADIVEKWPYTSKHSPEQEAICKKIALRAMNSGYTSGIINMKTGRGKTHVMSDIARHLPGKVLVLCHNELNARWVKEHFAKFHDKHDCEIVLWGKTRPTWDVAITTHKTFTLYPELFTDYEVILYDEMHKNISDAMIKALCTQQQCKALYGFSGTPYRDDLHKQDLEKIFGREIVIKEFDTPETRYNMLPKLYIETYMTPKYDYIDYNELRNCAMNDLVRADRQMETLIRYMNKFDRRCSLVFTDRVAEAEQFKKMLDKNPSISVVLIHWGINTQDALAELAKAKQIGLPIVIVWTIQKIWTWTDIPMIDAVFFFSPTKFNGTVVQGVGRGLRLSEGKTDIILVDWHDDDKAILHRQHLQRVKICKTEYWATVNLFPEWLL